MKNTAPARRRCKESARTVLVFAELGRARRSAIHYGQAVYEGAKAHHCEDGEVRLWNIRANANRMLEGSARMMMPEVPPDLFVRGCQWAVAANRAFVPPHGTGGAMYLRPYRLRRPETRLSSIRGDAMRIVF